MKILAIANQKGGVGKTTVACHMGFYAARAGLKVLMVDFDEGDLTGVFMMPDQNQATNAAALHASDLFAEDWPAGKAPLAVAGNISLIPTDPLLLDVDDLPLQAATRPKEALQRFSRDFDLCVIDTPPNLQRRFVAALVAADCALSPIDIGPFTVGRLSSMEKTMGGLRVVNPGLRHVGYLPAKVCGLSRSERQALDDMGEALGDRFIDAPIFSRPCIPLALSHGRPVWSTPGQKPSGSQFQAAREYRRACQEVFTRMGL